MSKSAIANDSIILEHALAYQEHGWSTIPLHVGDKRPCGSVLPLACKWPEEDDDTDGRGKGSWLTYQHFRASDAENELWWKARPLLNIGIVCGAISGIIAVDVDGEEGEETVKKFGALESVWQTTGNGYQVLFRHPGYAVRNFARKLPGIDLRGDGGYIVAAPSLHPNGKRYEWQNDWRGEMAELPQWILDAITEKPQNTLLDSITFVPELHTNGVASRAEKRVRAALRKEAEKVSVAPDGQKHVTLRDAAIAIGGFVYTGFVSEEEIMEVLFSAIEPRARDKQLARNTIKWGVSQGKLRKRDMPSDIFEESTLPAIVIGEQYADRKKNIKSFHLTDTGNAERLMHRNGDEIIYIPNFKKWMVWDGKRWNLDDSLEVERRARETVRSIYAEAAEADDEQERKKIAAWAHKSEAADKARAMIESARSFATIKATELDTDIYSLNCLNGTLNLSTGDLRPHRQNDYNTKITPVAYDPDAKCPRWKDFLLSIMNGSERMVTWLQKAVGYSLAGDTSEHCLFILYGTGANGKSTFLNILAHIMADYHMQCPTDTLMVRDRNAPTNDLARMRGARLVTASESDEGRRLAEGVVKQLTGGDMITCRFLNQEFFTYRPQFKIFLATNHRPAIKGTDHGIKRRLRMIPFVNQFWDADKGESGPPERKMNKRLEHLLRQEAAGILSWAVQGYMLKQSEGLGYPEEVKKATENYFDEQDPLNKFLEDCCVIGDGLEAKNQELYWAYSLWCRHNGENPEPQKILTIRLQEKGFVQERTGAKGRFWPGLGVSSEANNTTKIFVSSE